MQCHLGYASTAATAHTVICAACAPATVPIAFITGGASILADGYAGNYADAGQAGATELGFTIGGQMIESILRRRLNLPPDMAGRIAEQIVNTGETVDGLIEIVTDIVENYKGDPDDLEGVIEEASRRNAIDQ